MKGSTSSLWAEESPLHQQSNLLTPGGPDLQKGWAAGGGLRCWLHGKHMYGCSWTIMARLGEGSENQQLKLQYSTLHAGRDSNVQHHLTLGNPEIQRWHHHLSRNDLLWSTMSPGQFRICHLMEEVRQVRPLEFGHHWLQWYLDSGGFCCLHFNNIYSFQQKTKAN